MPDTRQMIIIKEIGEGSDVHPILADTLSRSAARHMYTTSLRKEHHLSSRISLRLSIYRDSWSLLIDSD
jgi:hypothetical protein